ncbi:hypothetical protein HBB16_02085 [Pseudonocardia sp. MCCB 268]|nr:hypothetical protein [Pseudonocardia cytotoxica]
MIGDRPPAPAAGLRRDPARGWSGRPLLRVLTTRRPAPTPPLVELQDHRRRACDGSRSCSRSAGRCVGLPADRAADVLWTLCAQANHDGLVAHQDGPRRTTGTGSGTC